MSFLFYRKKGFTLIELMIVMAIIAILVVIGIAAISAARKTARDTKRRDIAKAIKVKLEEYYIINKHYPKNWRGNESLDATYVQEISWLLGGDPTTPSDPARRGALNSYVKQGELIDPDPVCGDIKFDPDSPPDNQQNNDQPSDLDCQRYSYIRGNPTEGSVPIPNTFDDPNKYVLRVAMEGQGEWDADHDVPGTCKVIGGKEQCGEDFSMQ